MHSNYERLNFYVIHQKPYQDNKTILTIWVEKYGKAQAIISRLSKRKTQNLQLFYLYSGNISFLKNKDNALHKIYDVECIHQNIMANYTVQLSLFYINELIYWLLPSDCNIRLYQYYEYIINNLNSNNLKQLLRYFEIQLLSALGYSFQINYDSDGNEILPTNKYKIVPLSAFVVTSSSVGAVDGNIIHLLDKMPDKWDCSALNQIRYIVALNIEKCLNSRQLNSVKLMRQYWKMKNS